MRFKLSLLIDQVRKLWNNTCLRSQKPPKNRIYQDLGRSSGGISFLGSVVAYPLHTSSAADSNRHFSARPVQPFSAHTQAKNDQSVGNTIYHMIGGLQIRYRHFLERPTKLLWNTVLFLFYMSHSPSIYRIDRTLNQRSSRSLIQVSTISTLSKF